MENISRFCKKELTRRTVIIHQLTKDDFAKALLPRLVKGTGGQVVECHGEWMYREKYEGRSAAKPGLR
jgi:hypothetical protein